MARQARVKSESGMYFVTLRGKELFRSDADKAVFAQMLEKYFSTGEIYGVDLEKTKIDLVVKEGENGISMTMKPLITSYARYFNRTYNISGKLFSGRFISEPIETESEKQKRLETIKHGAAAKTRRTGGTQKPKKKRPSVETKKSEPEKIKPKSLPTWLL